VDAKSRDLIENVLKPKHLEPPPKGHQVNYLVDTKKQWLGSKCYFMSVYRSARPNAISHTLEEESGASLRAVGAQLVGTVKPKEWSRPSRERKSQEVYGKVKCKWEL
jgi:hypothetical protein